EREDRQLDPRLQRQRSGNPFRPHRLARLGQQGRPSRLLLELGRKTRQLARLDVDERADRVSALPRSRGERFSAPPRLARDRLQQQCLQSCQRSERQPDRKSTRLNSSHEWISYAVFCLK